MPARARREFLQGSLALAAVGLLSGCGLSPPSGQPASGGTKVRLIGVMGDWPSSRWDGFREGLRELDWVEGQNLAVEYRWTEGNNERYGAFAAELVQRNVELVVAGALGASIA